jgi:hypothetical protein
LKPTGGKSQAIHARNTEAAASRHTGEYRRRSIAFLPMHRESLNSIRS